MGDIRDRKPRAAPVKHSADKAILFEGANQTQLCNLFGVNNDQCRRMLATVPPDGERAGYPIWKIKTAAPHLTKPIRDFEAYLMKMSPADLPKNLSKEFWAGMRAKQEYELKAGDLWPTAKVIEKVGELLKLVKMSTLLFGDAVERTTELTERQRNMIKALSDGMLEDLHKKIIENFTPRNPADDAETEEDDDL